MSYIYLKCKECGEENEIYCDGDNAMMCPECRSVDELEEVEEEVKPISQVNEVFADIFKAHFPGLK